MRRVIIGFFTVLGVLVVLLVIGGAVTWHFLAPRTPAIAGSTILNLDLTQNLANVYTKIDARGRAVLPALSTWALPQVMPRSAAVLANTWAIRARLAWLGLTCRRRYISRFPLISLISVFLLRGGLPDCPGPRSRTDSRQAVRDAPRSGISWSG